MRKIISVILSIVILASVIPIAAYSANITSEISLDEFSEQLQELQSEYDDNYVSEIRIENDSEFYFVDGEENIITDSAHDVKDVVVTDNDFDIPLSAISDYCDLPETSVYSLEENTEDITVDKETAQDLGFEVEIEDGTAILTQPYQTQRLIVKSKYDINPLDSVSIVEGYNDLHIVQFDNQESAKEAQEYYESQKLIEYAEPDLVVSTMNIDYVDCGSLYSEALTNYGNHLSWGSETIGIDDYVDFLENTTELPEIIVGIIDTGIDLNHEFLQDRIIETNYNVSDTGDRNSEEDDHGHGTHVAGIVADNTTENVKLKSFKCLNSNGNGDLSGVVLSVYKTIEEKVNVINMSLGTRGKNLTLEKAVNMAVSNGITVCVAAGNDGIEASKFTPACIDDCITVGAIDAYDREPWWTNYGKSVDIVSPGVSILSTYNNGNYKTLSGTSMATPFVSAASAMLLCKNINYTPSDICNFLLVNGRKWSVEPCMNENVLALYIGNLTDFSTLTRTPQPEFNYPSGKYSDEILLEILCSDENAEIYYTLDGNRATKEDGILYTKPILIDKITNVHAVAYSQNKLKSLQNTAQYYMTSTDSENNFEIDSNGVITKYNGNNNFLTIPNSINGITVTAIGPRVFYRSSIEMVRFPDTLTKVYKEAFYYCPDLTIVTAKNLKYVGTSGFQDCQRLTDFDFSTLEEVDDYGFAYCYNVDSIYNDKLTKINDYAFHSLTETMSISFPNVTHIGVEGLSWCCNLFSLSLPKVEYLDEGALEAVGGNIDTIDLPSLSTLSESGGQFTSCFVEHINMPNLKGNIPKYAFGRSCYLKEIYIPFVSNIDEKAFEYCNVLKTIFAPSLEASQSLPPNNVDIYLSNKCTELPITEYNYTVIAPPGSYAQQWANENGYTFIDINDVKFTGINSANEFVYTSDFTETCIPLSWVADSWDESTINKSRYDAPLMMIFDFNNDKVINAKDYAQLIKYKA